MVHQAHPQQDRHDFVLMARAGLGFLGRYNDRKGDSPFERFYLGGSGLTGFQLDGREIVGLRGYDDGSLSPARQLLRDRKYTAELRFPVSLNPQATIYTLGFAEAGNTWSSLDRFDPFKVYRSAGIGLRLFLPMFGPMGLDYGWRFDDVPGLPSMAKQPVPFHDRHRSWRAVAAIAYIRPTYHETHLPPYHCILLAVLAGGGPRGMRSASPS
jgi:outer membrane protein assembly factor BamA